MPRGLGLCGYRIAPAAHDDCLRYLGCWLEASWKKSIHSVVA